MFQEWWNEVTELDRLVIPRPYFDELEIQQLEVHIFSDASPKAYGSVAYFKIKYHDKCTTSFIISKCRLAPLKKITLPRLELLGNSISARLSDYIRSTLSSLKESDIFMWTDSTICLHWIRIVRNRVLEIEEKTNP
ncbi:uncharacterized protein LOC118188308 [Stegodyphus dumicola]|uniref:uncharacterized protein LOC118188308 n=1 Tax=Stegodyphus dumicola TaxID=202533 RepID=UPI0015B1B7E6|nr:uncharacterized protein LOC118188308 [Stegodyphus dumicola]